MKYKASLDNLAKIMTVGVTVVFAVIIMKQIEAIKEEPTITSFLVAGGFMLIYIWTLLFRPLNYQVTDKYLIIHRPLKDVIVERKTIASV